MARYWEGADLCEGANKLELNQVQPQEVQIADPEVKNRLSPVINLREMRHSTVIDKLQTEQTPKFSESALIKDDPLRIAKRKRINYGNILMEDRSDPLKVAKRQRVDYGDAFLRNPVEKKQPARKSSNEDPGVSALQNDNGRFEFAKDDRKRSLLDLENPHDQLDEPEHTLMKDLKGSTLEGGKIRNRVISIKKGLQFDKLSVDELQVEVSAIKRHKKPKMNKHSRFLEKPQ